MYGGRARCTEEQGVGPNQGRRVGSLGALNALRDGGLGPFLEMRRSKQGHKHKAN